MCEDEATRILRSGLQCETAQLMPFQLEVVTQICESGRNVLYIDKTGAGKSETYFVIAKLLRESDAKAGPVIVVTPLVALMVDQVRRAKAFGLKAFALYSAVAMSEMERASTLTAVGKNKADLLFITAEMLHEISSDLQTFPGTHTTYVPKLLVQGPALKLNPPAKAGLSWSYVPLLVIDEIHYIAEAGHSFRVKYSTVWSKFSDHEWFRDARKLGLTATVTPRVRASIIAALPEVKDWHTVLGSLYRDNISIRILSRPKNDAERLNFVHQLFNQDKEAYILVFCKTVDSVKQYHADLIKLGVPATSVGFYYSAKGDKAVLAQEKLFREGQTHVLFTTCALGLGYDKSNITYVVHMWTPNSMVQYYQEIGRAGRTRTGNPAVAYMLPTTPWNPTGWVPVLSDICWYLAKRPKHSARVSVVERRESDLKHKESAVAEAISLGVQKGMLALKEDRILLLDEQKTIQTIDKLFADNVKDEVQLMSYLAHNCNNEPRCLWRFLLCQFEGQHNDALTCGKCSGLQCSPGGDIAPNSQAQGNVYYKITVPGTQTHILALNTMGEELDIDEDRVREIFNAQRPSMVAEPPAKWTICPLPDSDGRNLANAEFLAQMLNGMEVNTFISKNPLEIRKVMQANSQSERRDILANKFLFDFAQMPKLGNVLLYDNVVSSGDTIHAVVSAMRTALNGLPMDIEAFVQFVYSGKKGGASQVERLTIP